MRIYNALLRLYPADVRFAYGREMRDAYAARRARRRVRGVIAVIAGDTRETLALLVDVLAERVSALYSHRSFHGPRRPDLGMVRPPNVGKSEWFGR